MLEEDMGAFRHSFAVSLALILAVIAAVVTVREAAAQAQTWPTPQVAYQRLDSLEIAAITGSTFADRLRAVSTIARISIPDVVRQGECALGPAPSVIQYPGLVTRLAAIYRRSQDTSLRHAILTKMLWVAECAEAAAFLAEVAEEAPPALHAPSGPVLSDDMRGSLQEKAVGVLMDLGPSGETTLRRLHGQGTVRDSRARALLDTLSRQGFRRPK